MDHVQSECHGFKHRSSHFGKTFENWEGETLLDFWRCRKIRYTNDIVSMKRKVCHDTKCEIKIGMFNYLNIQINLKLFKWRQVLGV